MYFYWTINPGVTEVVFIYDVDRHINRSKATVLLVEKKKIKGDFLNRKDWNSKLRIYKPLPFPDELVSLDSGLLSLISSLI